MTDALQVQNLRVAYGARDILMGISLMVAPGKVTALVGGSGSGKTTLLRSILGLIPEASGRIDHPSGVAIRLGDGTQLGKDNESNLLRIRRSTGYVPQSSTLLPFLSLRSNVCLPLHSESRLSRAQAEARANQYLNALAVGHLADDLPWRVSGGERQRAALARALVVEPELLLLDEPTSALDVGTIKLSGDVIRRVVHERNCTALIATHNLGFVQNYCDEIFVLRDGVLCAPTTPADVDWSKMVTELL